MAFPKKKVTTGKAADKTVADMVKKSKAGKGTLSFSEGPEPKFKKGGFVPFKKKGKK